MTAQNFALVIPGCLFGSNKVYQPDRRVSELIYGSVDAPYGGLDALEDDELDDG